MPPDAAFVGFVQHIQLCEDGIGGRCAAHAEDGIVVGGVAEIGFCDAVELLLLLWCNGHDDDKPFQAVGMIVDGVRVIKGSPEGVDASDMEPGLEIGRFASGKDMAEGPVFRGPEVEGAVAAHIDRDVAAGLSAKPFGFFGMAFGGFGAV